VGWQAGARGGNERGVVSVEVELGALDDLRLTDRHVHHGRDDGRTARPLQQKHLTDRQTDTQRRGSSPTAITSQRSTTLIVGYLPLDITLHPLPRFCPPLMSHPSYYPHDVIHKTGST